MDVDYSRDGKVLEKWIEEWKHQQSKKERSAPSVKVRDLNSFSEKELVAELERRGWKVNIELK